MEPAVCYLLFVTSGAPRCQTGDFCANATERECNRMRMQPNPRRGRARAAGFADAGWRRRAGGGARRVLPRRMSPALAPPFDSGSAALSRCCHRSPCAAARAPFSGGGRARPSPHGASPTENFGDDSHARLTGTLGACISETTMRPNPTFDAPRQNGTRGSACLCGLAFSSTHRESRDRPREA
jgi:hypothetical protein